MNWISFFVGLLLGVWIATYAWNRYYRRDLWDAQRRLELRKFKVEESKMDSEIAKHELNINQMINERLK